MSADLSVLFNFTLTVSLTAALVLLLRGLLHKKAPPRVSLWLWAILAVRILTFGVTLPTSPVSAARLLPVAAAPQAEESPAPAAPNARPAAEDGASEPLPAPAAAQPQRLQSVIRFPGASARTRTVRFSAGLQRGVCLVWGIGASALALWFAGSYLLFMARVRRLPRFTDPALDSWRHKLKIRRGVRLRQAAEGPLLLGDARPQLLLPTGYTAEERGQIYLHELCHLKHHDNLWSMLSVGLLCLNWYNPLCWLAFRLFKRDLEFACDARVLRHGQSRKAYARLLLKALNLQQKGEAEKEEYHAKPEIQ